MVVTCGGGWRPELLSSLTLPSYNPCPSTTRGWWNIEYPLSLMGYSALDQRSYHSPTNTGLNTTGTAMQHFKYDSMVSKDAAPGAGGLRAPWVIQHTIVYKSESYFATSSPTS